MVKHLENGCSGFLQAIRFWSESFDSCNDTPNDRSLRLRSEKADDIMVLSSHFDKGHPTTEKLEREHELKLWIIRIGSDSVVLSISRIG